MRTVSIGNQDFESIRKKNCFYVDKTLFIKEWWDKDDVVTLIICPRRFGKTLNMSMLNCFFSNKYTDRGELFEGLDIWKDIRYRKIQGTYPTIFLSFASVKETNIEDAKYRICSLISEIYEANRYLLKGDLLSDNEKEQFLGVKAGMKPIGVSDAIKLLCGYMQRYYGKKVLIFLDEYDTPLQEAYISGYWNEMTSFMRSFFNSTFKTNLYIERAIMTGITRVSKESMFSDLNNLSIVSTTSEMYETCFGFTEKEVFEVLEEAGLSDKKEDVKKWYDGFIFGTYRDIYNPWSITNFINERKLKTYWVDTSSNALADKLIRSSSAEIKKLMEKLLNGESIVVEIDEQIVFNQLDYDENAIWSLLLASGYLRVENSETCDISGKYELSFTNLEVSMMFQKLIRDWFRNTGATSNEFVKALITDDIKAMNHYMNKIALATFSYLDVGNKPSEYVESERLASCYDCQGVANGSSLNYRSNLYAMTEKSSRFYHGFVLGLMVGEREQYIIKSNKESGFGRYDIMMIPKDIKNKKLPAVVIEFKVYDGQDEENLKDTVAAARSTMKKFCSLG